MRFLSIEAPARVGGFLLGCQAWTFNQHTVLEAIALTARAGGNVIEFYPGQKIDGDGEGLGPGVSDAGFAKVMAACEKHKVTPVAFGVTGLGQDQNSNRKLFEFAKKLGLRAITCEPDPNAFDKIEALVKEFDIRIALHNHPRQPNNPNYKYWDPNYALELLKGRDPRMGVCADLGHFPRSGIKPLDAVKMLKGRIMASHFKDVKPFGPSAQDVPFGTGVNDLAKVLEELQKQKFDGHLSLEYERGGDGPLEEVSACVGYIRGWAAARGK